MTFFVGALFFAMCGIAGRALDSDLGPTIAIGLALLVMLAAELSIYWSKDHDRRP